LVLFLDVFYDEESGYFYIVSEYCAGGDLFKKMKTQEGTFEEEQVSVKGTLSQRDHSL